MMRDHMCLHPCARREFAEILRVPGCAKAGDARHHAAFMTARGQRLQE